jgi:hypothetical protein
VFWRGPQIQVLVIIVPGLVLHLDIQVPVAHPLGSAHSFGEICSEIHMPPAICGETLNIIVVAEF